MVYRSPVTELNISDRKYDGEFRDSEAPRGFVAICAKDSVIDRASDIMLFLYQPQKKAMQEEGIERKFNELADEWRNDTAFSSSIDEMVSHPAYMKIVGMGKPALPLLLEALYQEPELWFSALKAIADEDPVPPMDRGHVHNMRDRWIEWGRARSYI